MCGIVGFVNYKKDIKNPISILNKMNNTHKIKKYCIKSRQNTIRI